MMDIQLAAYWLSIFMVGGVCGYAFERLYVGIPVALFINVCTYVAYTGALPI